MRYDNLKNTMLAGVVVTLLIVCIVPLGSSEQSDGLTGNTDGMSLNVNSAVIYCSGGTNSVELEIASVPSGVSSDSAVWSLGDLDDGVDFVTLSKTTGSSITITAGSLGTATVKTIEVIATIGVNHASAVVVVYASASETASVFHFYVKVDSTAIPDGESLQSTGFTDETTVELLTSGLWVHVFRTDFDADSEKDVSITDWNAANAFSWYCSENGWHCSIGDYGWVDTILDLGTYNGGDGAWIYWSQFHAENGAWVFNNTTMAYITTTAEAYIGLFFRVSQSAEDTVPFPGYPTGYT